MSRRPERKLADGRLVGLVQVLEKEYNNVRQIHDGLKLEYNRMIGPAEIYEKVLDRELSTEIINTSIKGVAFMREESYTTGAYFLEPYVVVPPGRSRQF